MSKNYQQMGKSILYKAGSEICKACTNTSTAKYQYSFSKSARFGPDTYKSLAEKRREEKKRREEEKESKKPVKQDYYSLPSTLDKRYTKFGYGKKVDFTAGKRYDVGKSATLSDETRNEIIEKLKKEVILKEPEGIKEKKKYYLSLMGSNFPSQFRSNEGISICERHYPKDSRDDNPGPGAYIMPSEFGIYQKEDPHEYKKKEYDDPKPWRHGMKKIKPKEEEDNNGNELGGNEDNGNQGDENNDQGNQEENQENQDNQDNQENQEENKNEENEKEEDKESECIMLRDMLMYKEEEKNENSNENANS